MVSAGLHASWSSRGEALQKLSSFVSAVFPEGDSRQKSTSTDLQTTQHFTVYIAREELKNYGGGPIPVVGRKRGVVLNYWCFSPGLGMKIIAEKGVRSIIITSGTLSPISAFAHELNIPFRERLENSHVIRPDQVSVGILASGPDKVRLNGGYHNRDNAHYLNSIGCTVLNVCRVVPQGVLVFFSSYSQLESCVQFWEARGIVLEPLKKHKQVFVEKRNKMEFQTVMQEFDKAVTEQNGAVLFAVCRGKVSEGIDFSDSHGRAVIMVGIPYPPLMDAKVCLKRHFLEHKRGTTPQTGQVEDWYGTEAVRAVNQAIGRVIRHKNDFGVILLADSRFTGWDKSRFPAWLRSLIVEYKQFGEMQRNLGGFFRSKGILLTKSKGVTQNSKHQAIGKIRPKITTEQKKLYEKFHKEEEDVESISERSFIEGIREKISSTFVESELPVSSAKRPLKSGIEILESRENAESRQKAGSSFYESESLPWSATPIKGPAVSSSTLSPEVKRKRIKLKRNEAGANESTGRSEGDKKTDYTPLHYLVLMRKELKTEKGTYKESYRLIKEYHGGRPIADTLDGLAKIWLPNHKALFTKFRYFVRYNDQPFYDKFAAKQST